VCGHDRGAPGEYNFQLECSNNPLAPILHSFLDVHRWRLEGREVPCYGRDDLPPVRIVKEVNLVKSLENLRASDPNKTFEELVDCVEYR